MKNGLQPGVTMDWINTTGATRNAGEAVVIGTKVGIVHETTISNAPGVLYVEGTATLPCTQADVFVQGAACS